jgi:hypothetical protein
LAAKKIVSPIKYMLNNQGQGFEKEGNRLGKEKGLIDIQEDTDLQTDRCQGLNHDMTTTVSSKRLGEPYLLQESMIFYGQTSEQN